MAAGFSYEAAFYLMSRCTDVDDVWQVELPQRGDHYPLQDAPSYEPETHYTAEAGYGALNIEKLEKVVEAFLEKHKNQMPSQEPFYRQSLKIDTEEVQTVEYDGNAFFAYPVTIPQPMHASTIQLDLFYGEDNRPLWNSAEHEGLGLLLPNGEFHGMRPVGDVGNVKTMTAYPEAIQGGQVMYLLSETPLNADEGHSMIHINGTEMREQGMMQALAEFEHTNKREFGSVESELIPSNKIALIEAARAIILQHVKKEAASLYRVRTNELEKDDFDDLTGELQSDLGEQLKAAGIRHIEIVNETGTDQDAVIIDGNRIHLPLGDGVKDKTINF